MKPSTDLQFDDFPLRLLDDRDQSIELRADPLPPGHPAEGDAFERQRRVPGHRQEALTTARVVLVGAGGLNGWTAAALLRAGVGGLTVIDPDTVERTNLTRQLFYPQDIGKPKALRLVHNLELHSTATAQITGIPLGFEQAAERYPLAADLLIVGVDNNACRLEAVRFARLRQIPAVFSMLSFDGLRTNVFLQGPDPDDACLWCALPNLDIERAMPCAAAFMPSCLLASAYAAFFAFRALMGWPAGLEPFNWREADLFGAAPERTGHVCRRSGCPACSNLG